jgi:dTDP-4-dehydrorhamnose 3,5-epimerase
MSFPIERVEVGLGVELIKRTVQRDHRGHFSEIWNAREFERAGLTLPIQQTSLSSSKTGTLRGLHFQFPYQQKLVTVLSGRTFTVAVDVRPTSSTYGELVTMELSADEPYSVLFPGGFAHGFLSLEDTVLSYHCDQVHQPDTEFSLLWCDPDLNIPWPLDAEPLLSPRDANATPFRELQDITKAKA